MRIAVNRPAVTGSEQSPQYPQPLVLPWQGPVPRPNVLFLPGAPSLNRGAKAATVKPVLAGNAAYQLYNGSMVLRKNSTSGSDYLGFGTSSDVKSTTFTYLGRAMVDTASGNICLQESEVNVANQSIEVDIFSNGLRLLNSNIAQIATTGAIIQNNKWFNYAISYDNTSFRYYIVVDGVLQVSGTDSSRTWNSGGTEFGIAGGRGGISDNPCRFEFFAMWPIVLPVRVALLLTRNPWAFIVPYRSPLMVGGLAAAAVTGNPFHYYAQMRRAA